MLGYSLSYKKCFRDLISIVQFGRVPSEYRKLRDSDEVQQMLLDARTVDYYGIVSVILTGILTFTLTHSSRAGRCGLDNTVNHLFH